MYYSLWVSYLLLLSNKCIIQKYLWVPVSQSTVWLRHLVCNRKFFSYSNAGQVRWPTNMSLYTSILQWQTAHFLIHCIVFICCLYKKSIMDKIIVMKHFVTTVAISQSSLILENSPGKYCEKMWKVIKMKHFDGSLLNVPF